jgi:flagellin
MAFSVNSNIGAQQVYNALAKTQAKTQSAQLQLATSKKVNSAADDTSGWNVGKQLEAASLKMKSQLSNISSAKNFLSTAESALQQVYDKLNQIQSKQEDSKDPLKDATSLQNDVKTLADEINELLTNTKINGADLLSTVASSFGAGASSVSINIGTKISDNSTATTALRAGDATSLTTSITTFQTNIRSAITYIGNQTQVLDSREEFLTASISNNDASIASIFDADTLDSQMTASQGQITGQLATSMMSQMNAAPQQLLQLFR